MSQSADPGYLDPTLPLPVLEEMATLTTFHKLSAVTPWEPAATSPRPVTGPPRWKEG